jgi:hypothetical protein
MDEEIIITQVYANQFGLKIKKEESGIRIIITSPDDDKTSMLIFEDEIEPLIKGLETLR